MTEFVFSGLTAIGTIAVAILAIWGEKVRSLVAAPRLKIESLNLTGRLTSFGDGRRVIYYHLKVCNQRSWAVARNCRVRLKAVHVRGPNQEFLPVSFPIPMQFVWAPAHLTPAVVDIAGEQELDFGFLAEGADRFEPALYAHPNTFEGFVHRNQAVRYRVEVVADGQLIASSKMYEVAWNGEWTDKLDKMCRT